MRKTFQTGSHKGSRPSGKVRGSRHIPAAGHKAGFTEASFVSCRFSWWKQGKKLSSGCLYPRQLLVESFFRDADIQQNGLACILRSGIKDMTELPEGQRTGHICPYGCSLDPSIIR